MKESRELYEIKLYELKFLIKKLQIHQKVHTGAATLFSDKFKEYIDSVEDGAAKHKLRKLAGLAGEDEKRMSKNAKRAKQAGQHRRGENKIKEPQEQHKQEQHYSEERVEVNSSSKNIPKEYKKLYRTLANATHPDKSGGDLEKVKTFQKIGNAISNGDYYKLIECALALDIEIPDEVPMDSGLIDEKIAQTKVEIKKITKSVAWEWYHIEEEEKRKFLFEKYIEFLLKNK